MAEFLEGAPPPKIGVESSEEEKKEIKSIVNLLEVSSEDNNWTFSEISTDNFQRWRAAFDRYVKSFNKQTKGNRKFTIQSQGENNYRIWRLM